MENHVFYMFLSSKRTKHQISRCKGNSCQPLWFSLGSRSAGMGGGMPGTSAWESRLTAKEEAKEEGHRCEIHNANVNTQRICNCVRVSTLKDMRLGSTKIDSQQMFQFVRSVEEPNNVLQPSKPRLGNMFLKSSGLFTKVCSAPSFACLSLTVDTTPLLPSHLSFSNPSIILFPS